MALYFQNNIKVAKKILKIVVKREKQLKIPGILVGRALNLLTAVYKCQKKFGKASVCVERARVCLEGQDSAHDKVGVTSQLWHLNFGYASCQESRNRLNHEGKSL